MNDNFNSWNERTDYPKERQEISQDPSLDEYTNTFPIAIQQKTLVTCDYCPYAVPSKKMYNPYDTSVLKAFVNMPCPVCGNNLLTEKDFRSHVSLIKCIQVFNFLWGWTKIFYSKEKLKKMQKEAYSIAIETKNGELITKTRQSK